MAGLLGLMFLAFIIQVVFRYFFNLPIGWTSELSVIAWLYIVLLGSGFWLKEVRAHAASLPSSSPSPRCCCSAWPCRRRSATCRS